MTMARSNRSADRDWGDRDDDRRVPGSLPIRLVEAAMRNPVMTGGIAVSLIMVAVTVANAVANQPARHPHPFFETRAITRGDARPATVAPTAPAHPTPSGLPNILPRPRPVSGVEDGLVRDLQITLAERGFYSGPVDGLVGPATAEAIKACERRLGTSPTGEASELLLAALRAAPSVVAQAPAPAAPAKQATPARAVQPQPQPQPAAPARHAAAPAPAAQPQPVAPPTPSMRVATADAVAYPAASADAGDYVEVDTPVFTGSIRRAAREPLASGGEEKFQKLQRALIAAGYGPLKADGRWDERSVSAVRRYEADHGWPVTGRPTDRLVWDLMAKVARR